MTETIRKTERIEKEKNLPITGHIKADKSTGNANGLTDPLLASILKAQVQTRIQDMKDNFDRIARLRPIDDDFFRCMAHGNRYLVERILQIILKSPECTLETYETQKDLKRLLGARSITLDIYGRDSESRIFDLEIQRQKKGANPKRARYYCSSLDIENLDTQQDFGKLPETFTIFLTETDFFGSGKPIYRVERMVILA